MAKKNKSSRKPPRIVAFEDFASADQVFLDAMDLLEEFPVKKEAEDHIERQGPRTRRRDTYVERTIDLHGLTLSQAVAMVDAVIGALQAEHQHRPLQLTIITGKGRHSGADGGVLVKEVHRHVVMRYGPLITHIDESPANVTVAGIPWRGHFKVMLRSR